MSPSGSRVARSALSTVLLTTALALGVSSAPSISAPAPGGPASDGPGTAAPDLLPRTVAGREALRVVGDDLAAVAELNGRSPAELRSMLLEEPSLVLTPAGRLAYRDVLADRSDPSSNPARATFPESQTFSLHSRPGSQRTIFLDFDGAASFGSYWSTSTGTVDGFSLDDDPGFNAAEHAIIQEVWQRVSEDYAPFDVDVTTEDPGQAAITRSGTSDQVYGARAQITGDVQAHADLCGSQFCTGIAYIGVFDEPQEHAALQPAWAFTAYFDDAASIAETVSHEVGHNLGLDHHGRGSDDYYAGHANWAPIMGSGLKPVIQWSNGSYSGATNGGQDDLAMITDTNPNTFEGGLTLVADEAGSTVATAATSVPSAGALITSRTDKDVFALGTCTGPVAVTASAAPVSPNLDIRLDLLDSAGTVLDTDDPASDFGDGSTAGGMGAAVSIDEGAGRALFARVDGVGTGSVDTGYDDYASLGRYTLDVTCSGGTTADVPGQVSGLSASSSAPTTATATWSAPADDGGLPRQPRRRRLHARLPRHDQPHLHGALPRDHLHRAGGGGERRGRRPDLQHPGHHPGRGGRGAHRPAGRSHDQEGLLQPQGHQAHAEVEAGRRRRRLPRGLHQPAREGHGRLRPGPADQGPHRAAQGLQEGHVRADGGLRPRREHRGRRQALAALSRPAPVDRLS